MFEEFFGSESFDVVKGVEMGIELEKKSIDYYTEKSKKMESKDAAELLRFIAKEEATHLKQLEMLKRSLCKKRWISAEKLGKPIAVKLYEKVKKPAVREGSGDVGILLAAARAEAEAREFYEQFSRKLSDKEGSKFFQRLAEFEQSHYELFDGLLKSSEVRVEGADIL